jgi:glucuronate isomerase
VARRVDSAFLARMVAEHRMDEVEAAELIVDLTYNLPKKAYKLDQPRPTATPAPTAKHAAE